MPAPDPTGVAEKDKARMIAVIEWGLFTMSVIAMAVIIPDALLKTRITGSDSDNPYTHTHKYNGSGSTRDQADVQLIVSSIIGGVALLIAAPINVVLTVGVFKENSTCCRVWWVINIIGIVFLCLGVLGSIIILIILDLVVIPNSIATLFFCYRIYALKTIEAYLDILTSADGDGDGGIA